MFLLQLFWNASVESNSNCVIFKMESPDGDQFYPGEVTASVSYHLTDDNELKILLKAAVKDKPTIINMTIHPSFNLSGTQKVN